MRISQPDSTFTNPVLTVSSKGWVVIPAEIRKKYHLTQGAAVTIVDYGGVLAIVPLLADPIEQGRGMLVGTSSLTQALLDERREEQAGEQ